MHNLPVGSKYSLNSKEAPYNVEYIYNPNMNTTSFSLKLCFGKKADTVSYKVIELQGHS